MTKKKKKKKKKKIKQQAYKEELHQRNVVLLFTRKPYIVRVGITKTRLFKFTENFTTKKRKFSD